jgi:hypothetical protein
VSSCGDGVTNATAGEACDGAGESADCNKDCTTAMCGDGVINVTAGEICEPTFDAPWDRCPLCDFYGAGLDGTFATKWETLASSPTGEVMGLQSFHYSGEPYLYDFSESMRYDIAKDSWSSVQATLRSNSGGSTVPSMPATSGWRPWDPCTSSISARRRGRG